MEHIEKGCSSGVDRIDIDHFVFSRSRRFLSFLRRDTIDHCPVYQFVSSYHADEPYPGGDWTRKDPRSGTTRCALRGCDAQLFDHSAEERHFNSSKHYYFPVRLYYCNHCPHWTNTLSELMQHKQGKGCGTKNQKARFRKQMKEIVLEVGRERRLC